MPPIELPGDNSVVVPANEFVEVQQSVASSASFCPFSALLVTPQLPHLPFQQLTATHIEFNDSGHVMRRHAKGGGGLATDADISGGARPELYGRKLEAASAWVSPADKAAVMEGGLEDEAPMGGGRRGRSSGAGGWDQFEENRRRFGVKAEFDENAYTTKLDRRKFTK